MLFVMTKEAGDNGYELPDRLISRAIHESLRSLVKSQLLSEFCTIPGKSLYGFFHSIDGGAMAPPRVSGGGSLKNVG
jgi:hypothetical protein